MFRENIIIKERFHEKKIISAVVIIATIVAILFCIFLPNQRSVSLKEEDLIYLSSIYWNDKETLISLGFIEYSLNNFTLDYSDGCVMRVTLVEDQNDVPFDFSLYESSSKSKFALWFSKNTLVQRNGYGVYKNANIYINESKEVYKSSYPEFISYLKTQLDGKGY